MCGDDIETHAVEQFAEFDRRFLVALAHAQQRRALPWQDDTGSELGLGIGFTERPADTHNLTGRFHFRPKYRIAARELDEREDGFLDRKIFWHALISVTLFRQCLTNHDFRRDFCERHSSRLGDKWRRAGGARIDFQQVHDIALDRELRIHQTQYLETFGKLDDLRLQFLLHLRG